MKQTNRKPLAREANPPRIIQIAPVVLPGSPSPGATPAEIHLFALDQDGACWWRCHWSESSGENPDPGWERVPGPEGAP